MKRVLLIDDDQNFLTVLRHMLQKEKFEIYSCSSGETALDLISSTEFDVIISDYKMGHVSGLTIVRTAKDKKRPIPVILLTAHAGGFWGSTWGNLPDKVFSKPVDFGELTEAVRDLCGQSGKDTRNSQNLNNNVIPPNYINGMEK